MASEDSTRMLATMVRIVNGYRRHADVMRAISEERKKLREHGYLDPLDGFPDTAASVAKTWVDRITADVEKLDDVDLISTMTSTVRETGRYYSEADLTWSKLWSSYGTEHERWLHDVRAAAVDAGKHRERFAEILPTLRERVR